MAGSCCGGRAGAERVVGGEMRFVPDNGCL